MQVSDWIAASASIAAFLSALATFLTVRQMVAQRQASYRPEIVMPTVYFKGVSKVEGGLPLDWFPAGATEDSDYSRDLNVEIHNIGLASAIDVVVEWGFEIEKFVDIANKFSQSALVQLHFSYANGFLSKKSIGLGDSTSLWVNQKIKKIDFIINTSARAGGVSISIPNAYKDLYSSIMYSFVKGKADDFPEIPKLKLNVAYSDISGRRLISSYDVSIEVGAIRGDTGNFDASVRSRRGALRGEIANRLKVSVGKRSL